MFSLKKSNSNPDLSPEDNNLKERLFYHDVINQTHGLLLFLGQRQISSGTGLNTDEVRMLEKELKTLQSLLHDHYNFKHKNLIQVYDWVPYNYVKEAFSNLVETYLPGAEVKSNFTVSEKMGEENFIHYPSFYRILSNIVKNISESNCLQVSFDFCLDEKGMTLETKNQMKKGVGSSESLAQVILDEKISSVKGLGLDSIHHVAEEHGGNFSFEISEYVWVNRLFLPAQKKAVLVKNIKIPA